MPKGNFFMAELYYLRSGVSMTAIYKSNQRWIWYAVEHSTNTILVYIFRKRKDVVFKKLQALLEPLNIELYYTDD